MSRCRPSSTTSVRKENLFFAVAERFSATIAETRGGVLPDDIAGAAAALVADYEQTGDANLRMLGARGARARGRGRPRRLGAGATASGWSASFPAALSNLRGARRRRCLAELLTITDVLTWKLLRRDHGLSRAQTVEAIRELLEAVHDHHKES